MSQGVAATAIVLAGGRSSRFGSDKLTADVRGEPMLLRAIRAVGEVCAEVLVVAPTPGLPIDLARQDGLLVIRDASPFEGPLVALVHVAPVASHDRLLLVGGDMPELQPLLLRRLLDWPEGRGGACLVVDGEPRSLPAGLERGATSARAAALIDAGERSLRALIAALAVEQIPEAGWRTLDPDGRSLIDIDHPDDLRRLVWHPSGERTPG
jgi:molybdopterin-guanine dinucleotide biosynthesis protein A